MNFTRRSFISAATASLAATRLTWAQEEPFTLWFPPLPLRIAGSFSCAVVASSPCEIILQIADAFGKTLKDGERLSLAPERAVTALKWKVNQDNPYFGMGATVYPHGRATPQIAGALRSDLDPAFSPVAYPSRAIPLEQIAEKALFVTNPARRGTNGHFTVTLDKDSDVRLVIKKASARGGPATYDPSQPAVYDHLFPRLIGAPGGFENPIPWSLRDSNNLLVIPGQYVATMTATPVGSPHLSGTMFWSSLEVV